jgi:hypothetical protein
MYRTCEDCGKEMKPNHGCDSNIMAKVAKTGKLVKRVRNEHGVCPDCNAGEGQVHHYGCDTERCPVCGRQFIGCDCIEGLYRVERKRVG